MDDQEEIREAVNEILDSPDLDIVTLTDIRQHVQQKLVLDLSDRKEQVDTIIFDVLEDRSFGCQSTEESEEEDLVLVEKPVQKRRPKHNSERQNDGGDYQHVGKKAKGNKGSDSDDNCKRSKGRGEVGGTAAKGIKSEDGRRCPRAHKQPRAGKSHVKGFNASSQGSF